ncbi:MAG TPA: type II toxin-antitoxin system VapC family toxin [bacterium]|nr:type II toxin-antitoxin system VapC family toxin [bacterium]
MKILLDTHIVLWWLADEVRLPSKTRKLITRPDTYAYVSSATVWEIAIKKSLGKLVCPDNLEIVLRDNQFEMLDITWAHAWQAGQLPRYHDDPFDRMLIAQALLEHLTVITHDTRFSQYEIDCSMV